MVITVGLGGPCRGHGKAGAGVVEATCVMGAWDRDMTAPGTEATVLVAKVVEAEVLAWEVGMKDKCWQRQLPGREGPGRAAVVGPG